MAAIFFEMADSQLSLALDVARSRDSDTSGVQHAIEHALRRCGVSAPPLLEVR